MTTIASNLTTEELLLLKESTLIKLAELNEQKNATNSLFEQARLIQLIMNEEKDLVEIDDEINGYGREDDENDGDVIYSTQTKSLKEIKTNNLKNSLAWSGDEKKILSDGITNNLSVDELVTLLPNRSRKAILDKRGVCIRKSSGHSKTKREQKKTSWYYSDSEKFLIIATKSMSVAQVVIKEYFKFDRTLASLWTKKSSWKKILTDKERGFVDTIHTVKDGIMFLENIGKGEIPERVVRTEKKNVVNIIESTSSVLEIIRSRKINNFPPAKKIIVNNLANEIERLIQALECNENLPDEYFEN